MWVVLGCPDASDIDKTTARKQFLAASNAVKSAAMRRRELSELALFRDVEAKQRDSKLFWANFKRLKGTTRTDKSPPPVAENDEGEVVTDTVSSSMIPASSTGVVSPLRPVCEFRSPPNTT